MTNLNELMAIREKIDSLDEPNKNECTLQISYIIMSLPTKLRFKIKYDIDIDEFEAIELDFFHDYRSEKICYKKNNIFYTERYVGGFLPFHMNFLPDQRLNELNKLIPNFNPLLLTRNIHLSYKAIIIEKSSNIVGVYNYEDEILILKNDSDNYSWERY